MARIPADDPVESNGIDRWLNKLEHLARIVSKTVPVDSQLLGRLMHRDVRGPKSFHCPASKLHDRGDHTGRRCLHGCMTTQTDDHESHAPDSVNEKTGERSH